MTFFVLVVITLTTEFVTIICLCIMNSFKVVVTVAEVTMKSQTITTSSVQVTITVTKVSTKMNFIPILANSSIKDTIIAAEFEDATMYLYQTVQVNSTKSVVLNVVTTKDEMFSFTKMNGYFVRMMILLIATTVIVVEVMGSKKLTF